MGLLLGSFRPRRPVQIGLIVEVLYSKGLEYPFGQEVVKICFLGIYPLLLAYRNSFSGNDMAKKKAKQVDESKPLEKPVPNELMPLVTECRQGVLEPEDVFVVNALARMDKMGFSDESALADHLNLRREDRKWLGRALTKGLKRPNKATADLLKKLAKALGCSPDDLWKKDLDFDPWLIADDQRPWRNLVHEVRAWTRNWELIKRRSPEVARKILQEFEGSEEDLIADWIARENGASRPKLDRDSLQTLLTSAFIEISNEDWTWEQAQITDDLDAPMGSVGYYVHERAKTHPFWDQFVSSYLEPLYEQVLARKRKQGRREEIDDMDYWQMWVEFLHPLSFRQPTPEEVFEQFRKHFLDADSPEQRNVAEGLAYILPRLVSNVDWPEWVRRKHDGDLVVAESFVKDRWREAVIKHGAKIGPSHFVAYFERILQTMNEAIDDRRASGRR